MKTNLQNISKKLAHARYNRKFLPKISKSLISNPNIAAQICRHAEMELLWNPIGFKAGATNKSMWKKLKAKKPFFSYLYKLRFWGKDDENDIPQGEKRFRVRIVELENGSKVYIDYPDETINKTKTAQSIINILYDYLKS